MSTIKVRDVLPDPSSVSFRLKCVGDPTVRCRLAAIGFLSTNEPHNAVRRGDRTLLNHLSIINFRCFRSVEVPLRALTVLIGPNDTGKSSFLSAIEMLTLTTTNERRNISRIDRFRNEAAEKCQMQIAADLNSHDQAVRNGVDLINVKNPFLHYQMQRVQLPINGIATQCEGFTEKEADLLQLGEHGERTAAFLDYLLRNDLNRLTEFKANMRRLVPGFEDLKIETPDRHLRRIDLIIEDGLRIDGMRASAGVRLLLFFLAISYHPKPPSVLLIEEPENGIHPRRLKDVMSLLRGLTIGEFGGSPVQVILTTHSPYLLDCVDLETDQVLVFQREEDGSRSVQTADKQRIDEFFDGFLLGEVWFNEQEAGLVAKGVR